MPTPTQKTIAEQNDKFRKGEGLISGQIVITRGIDDLLKEHRLELAAIVRVVQDFDTFTEDNDPHHEHDFGQFDFQGQSCFWKIDLYDLNYQFGSEAPDDPTKTRRVLTILLAIEY